MTNHILIKGQSNRLIVQLFLYLSGKKSINQKSQMTKSWKVKKHVGSRECSLCIWVYEHMYIIIYITQLRAIPYTFLVYRYRLLENELESATTYHGYVNFLYLNWYTSKSVSIYCYRNIHFIYFKYWEEIKWMAIAIHLWRNQVLLYANVLILYYLVFQ